MSDRDAEYLDAEKSGNHSVCFNFPFIATSVYSLHVYSFKVKNFSWLSSNTKIPLLKEKVTSTEWSEKLIVNICKHIGDLWSKLHVAKRMLNCYKAITQQSQL